MALKIALVTSWKVRCGIATYSENLANALAHQDVEVYVVRVPRFGKKTPTTFTNLAGKIPLKEVDLIHVQHEYGIYQNFEGALYVLLRRLAKPVITTMHAVGNWFNDRLIAEGSSKIIVHNKFCQRIFKHPSVIIPHGAVSKTCPPMEECKRMFGIDPKIPMVGYMGFISKVKGIENLVLAMVGVEKAGLLITGGWHAGPGTEYNVQLRDWSFQQLKNRVQWTGFIPEEQVARTYGAMDIVVYPSRVATESGALIMALGHGKAVVASDVAPFKEKEEVGALLTFKDIQDLSRQLNRLLKDEKMRQALEEGARAYCKKTSWDNVAEQHVDLYEGLLKNEE